MKRNYFIFIGIVILAIAAYFLTQKDSKSTVTDLKASYQFAVKDTASITRIVMRDKTPKEVTLVRKEGRWFVSGERPARRDAIEVLLETIYRMEMRNFVQENAQVAINRQIDVFGTEVEIYQGEKKVKHFFVGTETGDQLGTHMRMAGYEDAFAVHILGFNGYLNTRFFTSAPMWYDRTIWGFDNLSIASAGVKHPLNPEKTFTLKVENNISTLYNGDDQKVNITDEKVFQIEAQKFLAGFRNTQYEGVIIPSDPIYSRKDSLLNSTPYFEIWATNKAGVTHTLNAYRIKAAEDTYDIAGNPREFDPDRLHAFVDNKDIVLVQYYGLQNVLKNINDFVR